MINTHCIMATDDFNQLVNTILEDMMSSTVFGAAASGDKGGQVPGGSDWYAPGTAIVPKVLGQKRKGKVPMQRRRLSNKR